ncbi:LOG family protein [uncultured Ramlibacter sp.]|uniref:LOG family protein n=1 Tax=uncultured Ramlibacter sp. TaxID=260755 RepID=UPI00261260BE|nr:LOG family protein [uncultured Ramlibacter sp.]
MNVRKLLGAAAAACVLAACQGLPAPAAGAGPRVDQSFYCTVAPAVPNASYVGPYAGVENVIAPLDAARDVHCADSFKAGKYPRGFVTIFGSSRIAKDNRACDAAGKCDQTLRENDHIYAAVREFAFAWTAKHGRSFPILTGAGPGLMEAGNEGAKAAGGPSLGYTTYYDRPADPAQATASKPYGGDAAKAFNAYVSDGLIFTSVAQREAAMVRHSAAIVVTPGGTGTEWEIYQVIETIKSRQQAAVPVYFLGERARDWKSLDERLKDLVARRVVRADELAFLRFAATPAELLERLAKDLALP